MNNEFQIFIILSSTVYFSIVCRCMQAKHMSSSVGVAIDSQSSMEDSVNDVEQPLLSPNSVEVQSK